jgi:hypothetical protein
VLLFQHLAAGTAKTHDGPRTRQPVSGKRSVPESAIWHRLTAVSRIFTSPYRPNSLWGRTSFLYNRQTPWPQSASELYRPSDRRLSAKLVSTFADRRVSSGQCGRSQRPYSRISRPDPVGGGSYFPEGLSSRGIELTTHLQLVSRSRYRGSVHSNPNKSLCRRAWLVKDRVNFACFN